MTSSLWPIFVLNIGLNSFLMFITVALLVQAGLRLLCIRSPRVRALCLFLPFLKLAIDLGSYQFSDWALAQSIDPLSSPEGTRFFSAGLGIAPPMGRFLFCHLYFHLIEGQTFSLADLLCLKVGPGWTLAAAIVFLGATALSCVHGVRRYCSSLVLLERLREGATVYSKVNERPCSKATIYLTKGMHSPFITGQIRPKIYFPKTLFEVLSQDEFEAILLHELAHFRYGDLIMNGVLFWLSIFFWWIPMKGFRRKMELAQEYACDDALRSKTEKIHLGEALLKTSSLLKEVPSFAIAQPSAASHHVVERLKRLVLPPAEEELSITKWIKMTLMIGWAITLACAKLWIF